MNEKIKCIRCGSKMTFGGATPDMHAQFTDAEILANMAEMLGWQLTDEGWLCRSHRINE